MYLHPFLILLLLQFLQIIPPVPSVMILPSVVQQPVRRQGEMLLRWGYKWHNSKETERTCQGMESLRMMRSPSESEVWQIGQINVEAIQRFDHQMQWDLIWRKTKTHWDSKELQSTGNNQ